MRNRTTTARNGRVGDEYADYGSGRVMRSSAPPSRGNQAGATRRWRFVRRFIALLLAALTLSGCTVPTFGAHKGVTTSSRSVFHLWQGFSISAAIIGTIVVALVLWIFVRYGRTDDTVPEQTQYHLPIETFYIVVPILIIAGLFAATLVVENKEVANPETNVTVDVNAFQWGWKFTYPGTETVVIADHGDPGQH
jgi:cytochrome c oxidase subunit 2